MNVVDSSAWLEYLADGPNAPYFAEPIERTEDLVVPSITIFEVYKRMVSQLGTAPAMEAINLMEGGFIVDLDESLALHAARLSIEYRLPLADSVILATARALKAAIWTQDADFKDIEGVNYRERRK